MKNQQSYLMVAVAIILVGAGAFYGGMQYQLQQKSSIANVSGQFARFNNQGGAAGGQARQGNMMTAMRPISGEIISQDESSITVKLPDGSTKIVILAENTIINIASAGAKADLKIGEKVTTFGTQNQDGSVTAQNVSIGETTFGGMGRMGNQLQGSPSASPESR